MVQITPKAKEELVITLNEKETKKAVRVYIAGIGCGGPSLGLTLDDVNVEDKIFDFEDFQVVVHGDELPNIGGIEIDFRESRWGNGFVVRSSNSSSCSI